MDKKLVGVIVVNVGGRHRSWLFEPHRQEEAHRRAIRILEWFRDQEIDGATTRVGTAWVPADTPLRWENGKDAEQASDPEAIVPENYGKAPGSSTGRGGPRVWMPFGGGLDR